MARSATAACAVVRLGGKAAFWARVGDDANGHAAIKSLTEAGLDCSGVRLVTGVRARSAPWWWTGMANAS